MRFLSGLLVSILLASVTAPSQIFRVEEDLSFARGLARRRMYDLARQILDRVLDDPSHDASVRAQATLELAHVYKDMVHRGRNLAARLEASEKADAAFQTFIRDFGDHPRIIEAKMDYAEFLLDVGRYRLRLKDETILVEGPPKQASAHREKALEGYKLWGRFARIYADGTTLEERQEYLKARFHQNLVRWAQGRGDLARKSLRFLRIGLGQNLDRKKGSAESGYWERRFEWLEKQIRRRRPAPQSPPPLPEPTHFIVTQDDEKS